MDFYSDQGDRTRNRDRVHATFLARGYRSDILDNAVVDYPDDGPNSAQLARVSSDIGTFIDQAHAAGRKVLAVDDGGLVARGYAAQTAARRVDAAVELTVSGLKRIRAVGPLAIPILNMARSQVKTHLGYLEIADSCMRRLRSILPAQKFIGRPVLLLGFGTLGSRLAPALRALGCQLSVVDTDMLTLIGAAEAGYTTYPDTAAALRAIRPFLIIGTTGEMALLPDDLPYIPDGVHLAPFATHDFSIFTNPLTAPLSIDIPGVGRCYTFDDGRKCVLLGDGRSLNLFEADSIPNQGYDAYRAGTIIAIKELCATQYHLAPGLYADVVDSAIDCAGLYEAYYKRYLVQSPVPAASTVLPLPMRS